MITSNHKHECCIFLLTKNGCKTLPKLLFMMHLRSNDRDRKSYCKQLLVEKQRITILLLGKMNSRVTLSRTKKNGLSGS